jgi:NAD(P)-dependent dehydrogenase (short-subunit alcohol dehydrogenase family)
LSDISRSIPLGRAGTLQEMASAIYFFVSEASSYMTGQTLAVDGGPAISGIADDQL